MKKDRFANWLRHEIRGLKEVEHGGQVWRYSKNRGTILDFSSNANPPRALPKSFENVKEKLKLDLFPTRQ